MTFPDVFVCCCQQKIVDKQYDYNKRNPVVIDNNGRIKIQTGNGFRFGVVLCTGYSIETPFVENGTLIQIIDNQVHLYKYMYPVETSDHNTLAMIRQIQQIGSLPVFSEMQCRFFFHVLSDQIKLPSAEKMMAEINRIKEVYEKRVVKSRRHTVEVPYIAYMNELSGMIGAKPKLFRMLFTDPILACRCFFCTNLPYAYRLYGPHIWPGARAAIMDVEQRITTGLRKSQYPAVSLPPKKRSRFPPVLFSIVVAGGAVTAFIYASEKYKFWRF